MLAGSSTFPPDSRGWVFEPKWDGVRTVARVWSGRITLTSRLGNEVTAGYPELGALPAALGDHAAVLDGEIVAFDGRGRPSFEVLQRRMHVRQPSASLTADVPVMYAVFDLMWLDGHLLTELPFTDRRRLLEGLVTKGPSWQTSPQLPAAPDDEMLAVCRRTGLEGYVGKFESSPYLAGKRSKAWTKVKCRRQREFVVGGWSEGEGGRSGSIGSLAVGWVDPEAPAPEGHPFALRYAGQVGSGLGETRIADLSARFAAGASDTSPFVKPPPIRLHFVRPTVVVEVKFTEVTSAGVLRQPSIKGVRNDKDPAAVVWTDELAS